MSSTKGGTNSVNDSGIFEVREFSEFMVSGPADNRMTITPGESSSIQLNISNDGILWRLRFHSLN